MIVTTDPPPPLSEEDIVAAAPSYEDLQRSNLRMAEVLARANASLIRLQAFEQAVRPRVARALGILNNTSPDDGYERFLIQMADIRTELNPILGLSTKGERQ